MKGHDLISREAIAIARSVAALALAAESRHRLLAASLLGASEELASNATLQSADRLRAVLQAARSAGVVPAVAYGIACVRLDLVEEELEGLRRAA